MLFDKILIEHLYWVCSTPLTFSIGVASVLISSDSCELFNSCFSVTGLDNFAYMWDDTMFITIVLRSCSVGKINHNPINNVLVGDALMCVAIEAITSRLWLMIVSIGVSLKAS